ncbi:MAG: FitA-like ribbon-helix-helix domain-containing protein [bacterium]
MAVNLSIKKVPDHVAKRLRGRAIKNHRSLQGELLALLEESVASEHILTPSELLADVRKSGLKTGEEIAKLIRKDRRRNHFRLRKATFKGKGLQPYLERAPWDKIRELSYEGRGG